MQPERVARWALVAAISSWVLWPVSYAWILLTAFNPSWLLMLVPIAEIGAIALASAAVIGGVYARRRLSNSRDARWAVSLGVIALLLVIGGNVLAVALLG